MVRRTATKAEMFRARSCRTLSPSLVGGSVAERAHTPAGPSNAVSGGWPAGPWGSTLDVNRVYRRNPLPFQTAASRDRHRAFSE
jgi:hypothetical protein